ncbi:MAG: lysozyme [Cyanobacteria bacterium J06638_20]
MWTIGIGHTKTARAWQTITKEQAIALFKQDIRVFERGVEGLLTVETTQPQFDALVSFAFNLGLGALRSSTLLKRHNRMQFDKAANEFGRWVNASGERMLGLVRRRAAERDLYLS